METKKAMIKWAMVWVVAVLVFVVFAIAQAPASRNNEVVKVPVSLVVASEKTINENVKDLLALDHEKLLYLVDQAKEFKSQTDDIKVIKYLANAVVWALGLFGGLLVSSTVAYLYSHSKNMKAISDELKTLKNSIDTNAGVTQRAVATLDKSIVHSRHDIFKVLGEVLIEILRSQISYLRNSGQDTEADQLEDLEQMLINRIRSIQNKEIIGEQLGESH